MLTEAEWQALILSLRVGGWSVAASLPVGIAVALALARARFPGKTLVDGLVHLPLVVPPVVVGYLLLVLLGRKGPLGALIYDLFGVTVAFSWRGAAIASAVMGFPLLVRAIRLSLDSIDRGLEAAARTLGAGRARVFATVTLPLILPGILTGAVLAFARSLGEFGATITFVSNIPGETRTLPLALYSLTQTPGGDHAALRLTVISVALAMVALVLSEFLSPDASSAGFKVEAMIEIAAKVKLGGFTLDAAFTIESAGVTALFGRSGAGKTSVINAVAGLLRPDSGRIAIDDAVLFDSARGLDLAPERRRVGYVFQDGRLFPHLSVRGNLSYGMRLTPRDRRYVAFDQVVALLGLEHLLERRPAKLSGGEKQRVALGRALLTSPRLMLMDEPLAALDQARKNEILPFISRLTAAFRVPVIYVSHAADEVLRIADHVVLMADGKISATGPVDALAERLTDPALDGGERTSLLSGVIERHEPEFGLSHVATAAGGLRLRRIDLPEGSRVRLNLRARDVALALSAPRDISILNSLPGRIVAITPAAEGVVDVELTLGPAAAGGPHLCARITARAVHDLGLAPGGKVHALIKSVAIDRFG